MSSGAGIYFDPGVSLQDRALLSKWTDQLVPAGEKPPRVPSRLRPPVRLVASADWRRLLWFRIALLFFFLGAAAGGGSDLLHGGQGGQAPGTYTNPLPEAVSFLLAWISWLCIANALVAVSVGMFGVQVEQTGTRARRRAIVLHGKYVAVAELDYPSAALLARAQRAADRITGARVFTAGRLDAVALGLTVDQFLWDLAKDLSLLSRQRDHLRARPVDAGPAVRAVAGKIEAKVTEATRALHEQVCSLSDLAGKIAELDVTYRDAESARELLNGDGASDIDAARARDALTLEAIASLAEQVPWWAAEIGAEIDSLRAARSYSA